MPVKRPAALWIAALALACVLVTASAASARDITHIVQKGQNLGMIAHRYHTTAKAIRARNGLKRGLNIHPGQKLRVVEVEEHARWRRHLERKKAPKVRKKADSKRQTAKLEKKKRRTKKKNKKKRAKAAARKKPPKATSTTRKGKPSHRAKAKPTKPQDPYARAPRRPGWVQVVRHGEKFRGTLVAGNGQVVSKSSKRLDRLLRSRRTGKKHRINRRLLKLLTQVSDHFGSRTIIVVSGYRPYSPKQFTRNSRHNHGSAIDFRIVGVPNHAVFAYCKRFRNVGCGLYPNSHFIHMDVRKRKTQWVDYSLPGQRPVYAHRKKRKRKSAQKPKRAQRPRKLAKAHVQAPPTAQPAKVEERESKKARAESAAAEDSVRSKPEPSAQPATKAASSVGDGTG
jgi:uncharacterized protein YcbK (DUF882 family)